MNRRDGYVYLLHFERPISPDHTCQHYVGWCKDLAARIQSHRLGYGARLTAVAKERGIGFEVVRVWFGCRRFERKIKNRKSSPRLCPCCNRVNPTLFELSPSQIEDELIPF